MFAQNDITKRCQTWALISKPVTIHKIFILSNYFKKKQLRVSMVRIKK